MSRDGGEQSTWYGITCWKVWAQGFGSGWAGAWSLRGWCFEATLDAACFSGSSTPLLCPEHISGLTYLQASCGMAQCTGRR